MLQKIADIYEPGTVFELEEASGEVDGVNILGKVKGDFFVPDGTSRNKRFYPRSLWEKVVSDPEVKGRMVDRRMFGSVGHGQKLDDAAILEGKVSHVVTGLSIQGGRGIGEALILGTPAGKILNTLLRAKCKLFVSSRADGEFKGEMNGVPVVNPDTYRIQSWDFVIDPGFLQANPGLVESLEKLAEGATSVPQAVADQPKSNDKGDSEMSTQVLVENLAKENGTLKADLEKATTELETMKNENVVLKDENKHLKFEVDKMKGFKATSEALQAEIAKFKELGSIEEMTKFVENVENFTKEVGSFAEVKESLVRSEQMLKEYNDIGPAKRIETALDNAHTVIAEYKKRGSLKEIDSVIEKVDTIAKEAKLNERKAKVSSLAKELGVGEAKIEKVYDKMTEEEIRELFKDVAESNKITTKFKKTEPVTEGKEAGKEGDKPAEPVSKLFTQRDSGERLMESLYPGVTQ